MHMFIRDDSADHVLMPDVSESNTSMCLRKHWSNPKMREILFNVWVEDSHDQYLDLSILT